MDAKCEVTGDTKEVYHMITSIIHMTSYERVKKHFPGRIPIIVSMPGDKTLPELKNKKYLAPKDLPIARFQYILRQRMELDSSKALFLFVNDDDKAIIPVGHQTIGELTTAYGTEAGVLRVSVSAENTFGTV